jgi:hypothetical protein
MPAAGVFGLLAPAWYAQEFRATVTGHVVDTSAAAMPKVSVQVVNLGTSETAVAITHSQGISRWTMPAACALASASAIWMAYFSASGSGNGWREMT